MRQWTSSDRGEDVFGYRTYGRNEVALTFIKATHTLAWLSIESCMAFVLYAGAAKRTDRRGALAGAVVAGEASSLRQTDATERPDLYTSAGDRQGVVSRP